MELSPDLQAKLEQVAKLPLAARVGIMTAIGLLIATGYYFGSYQDSSETLAGLRARELELQRELSEVRSVASNIAAFEEEITNLEVRLSQVLRQLPNKRELEVLLTDISNLGKTAGVEIKSFRRRDESTHEFYAEVPIDLELEGTYHEVAKFFDLVSKLLRIVNVSSLTVKVESESFESTRLKVTGTATTFRYVGDDRSA